MNKQPSKAMIERMEFVNCLNRELNMKLIKMRTGVKRLAVCPKCKRKEE